LNQVHTPDDLVFIKIREVIFSLKPWSQSANFYVIVIFGRDFKRSVFAVKSEKPKREVILAVLTKPCVRSVIFMSQD